MDGEGGLTCFCQDGEGSGLVSDSCDSRRALLVHQVRLVDPAHEIGGDLGRPFDVVVGLLDVGAGGGVVVVLDLEGHGSPRHYVRYCTAR